MKKTVLLVITVILLFSCEVKTSDSIMGKWRYDIDAENWYVLAIQKESKCTLTEIKANEPQAPLNGEIKFIDKKMILFFEEKSETKQFYVAKSTKKLILKSVRTPSEIMTFKKDEGEKK